MRAGRLDRTVTIERATDTVSATGTVTTTWTEFATVRAELVSVDYAETAAAFGEQDTGVTALRLRYVDVITSDRVMLAGETFDIVRIVEIGRRRGLELTCRRVPS